MECSSAGRYQQALIDAVGKGTASPPGAQISQTAPSSAVKSNWWGMWGVLLLC